LELRVSLVEDFKFDVLLGNDCFEESVRSN